MIQDDRGINLLSHYLDYIDRQKDKILYISLNMHGNKNLL